MKNLLSVNEASTNGTVIKFHYTYAIIYHKLPTSETMKITSPKSGWLYPLQMINKMVIQNLTTTG